jgi:MFS family permease
VNPLAKPHPWIIVFVGFFALALSFSVRMSLGVAMPTWEQSLNWSREVISGYGAIGLIVMAVIFPLVGAIVDRAGSRAVLLTGCFALAAATGLIASMDAPWQLLVAYGVFGGVGFTLVGNTLVSVMIARAFDARRGFATGIATSGATGGQLLFVPIITLAFTTIGWRASFTIIAVSCVALGVFAFLLLRGEHTKTTSIDAGKQTGFGESFRIFMRDPGFHALAASFFVCGVTTTGAIETHFIPFAALCGFPPMPSAIAYSILAGCNIIGMMAFGWLCDRFNRSHLLAVIYGVRALAFIVLLYVANDYSTLIVFAIVAGFVEYATLPATAGLAAARYGVANLGKAMGLLMTAHSLGAALGAYAGGRLFVEFGNYDVAWIASSLSALVAALIVFAATDPRHGRPGGKVAVATA